MPINSTDTHIFSTLAERAAQNAPAKDLQTIAGFLPDPEQALKAARKMVRILETEARLKAKRAK